ncbi:MAG: extracellular solute-binding protein [Pseudonocardiaceae bacterium]|nr:extracellular solute-binding protein [Pseudonocardiaceae bacterium]
MRRRTMFVGMALVAALVLAACGSSGPSRPGSSDGALLWAIEGGVDAVYQDSVDRFNESRSDGPGVELQTFQNDPYKQKLRVAIGADSPPDVFFGWGGGVLESYATAGKVHDLTPALRKDPSWRNKFLANVMETVTFDGKVYGIPVRGMQPVVLYYNKELFRQHGARPPKTWQDLLNLVSTFSSKGVTPISLGGASPWTYLMWEEYLVDRLGGPEVFDAILAGKPNAWSHPAVLQANRMIQQLIDAGAFGEGYASVNYDTGQQAALLYTNKAAMNLMGSWDYSAIVDSQPQFIKSGKLGWTTFPEVPNGSGDPNNVVGNTTNYYSVTKKSANKQVAIDYLKNTVMDEQYVDKLIELGDVPPVKGIDKKLAGAENGDYLQYIYNLAQNAPSFELSWDQALPPEQAEPLLTNLEQLFLKKITPRQFSTAMNGTLK